MHALKTFAPLCLAATLSTAAAADFAVGNEVFIQGVSGPEAGYTYWQGFHDLGDSGQIFTNDTFSTQVISVTSWVNSATSVSFSFDFSNYDPGFYSLHSLEIFGLKSDGSLASVTASQGLAYVQDGIKIRWDGSGLDLVEQPKLVLTIEQVPAPGGLVLLGVAGLMSRGRRWSTTA